jgi:hypothetical protein
VLCPETLHLKGYVWGADFFFEKYLFYLIKIFISRENKRRKGIYNGIYILFLKAISTTIKSK